MGERSAWGSPLIRPLRGHLLPRGEKGSARSIHRFPGPRVARSAPEDKLRPGSMTPRQPLPRMGPGLRPGRRRWGDRLRFIPHPPTPPILISVPVAGEGARYQPDAAAGSGRAGPGGGDVSLRSRRALVCAPARSWAAIRAVRRGRAGRVRDKRVNSPAHPGPAGERPRGALTFVETVQHYPYAGRRPGAPPPPRPFPVKPKEAAKPCACRPVRRLRKGLTHRVFPPSK